MMDRRAFQLTLGAGLIGVAGHANAEAALDFSGVTSRSIAEDLFKKGRLERILLFPAAFGGEDRPENVTFVPIGTGEAQALIIGTLTRYLDEGLIDQLNVEPVYRGDSFVPTKIRYVAQHSTKSGVFTPTLDNW